MTANERLNEYMWLVTGGTWPEDAAKRVGYTRLKSVETAAHRLGRADVLNTTRGLVNAP